MEFRVRRLHRPLHPRGFARHLGGFARYLWSKRVGRRIDGEGAPCGAIRGSERKRLRKQIQDQEEPCSVLMRRTVRPNFVNGSRGERLSSREFGKKLPLIPGLRCRVPDEPSASKCRLPEKIPAHRLRTGP